MNTRILFAIGLALVLNGPAGAQEGEAAESPWMKTVGEQFTFTAVREGVWHVQGTGSIVAGSNGALIESAADLLLVDSHMTPVAAEALLADLPLVSDKPIRYVVNTHFHFDHVQGNQVFGPEVEIVAHEFTHRRVASGDSRRGRAYDFFIGTIPDRIKALEESLESAEGEELAAIEGNLAALRNIWKNDQQTNLTAPTLALREALTLYRGGREIRLLFFGRGHTGGDVVVYLPAEKALVSGDLITHGLPYMGNAFFSDWPATLEAVQQLDVEVILPGHGPPFEDVERVGHLREYLIELWAKVVEMHEAGVPPADAAERIDLSSHSEHFEQIEGPGVSPHAVERAYELLEDSP